MKVPQWKPPSKIAQLVEIGARADWEHSMPFYVNPRLGKNWEQLDEELKSRMRGGIYAALKAISAAVNDKQT